MPIEPQPVATPGRPTCADFRTVVVGAADSQAARDAGALALGLSGGGPGATIVVAALAVDPLCDPRLGPGAGPARIAAAQDRAAALRDDLAATDPGCVIKVDAREAASVGGGLREVAVQHGAQLVVIGASRRSAIARIVGVNGVRATLDRAACAVAVAPRGYADEARELRRIGAGWDHTPPADVAVTCARDVAGARDAHLHVMRAVASGPRSMGPRDGEERRFRTALARDRLAEIGLAGADVEVREGHAAHVLADFSETLDLLVVGAAVRDGALHPGHTVHALLRHLACALLVVPADA